MSKGRRSLCIVPGCTSEVGRGYWRCREHTPERSTVDQVIDYRATPKHTSQSTRWDEP